MAKTKGSKSKHVPNKHIHARLSYLHQASSYLSLVTEGPEMGGKGKAVASIDEDGVQQYFHDTRSRHLLSQLRAVSLKAQIRLSSQIKHTLCKRCNSLLIAGKTSKEKVVNESKGGRKPQADVLVVRCDFCGTVKRFPVGQSRGSKTPAIIKDSPSSTRGSKGVAQDTVSRQE
jgi:ribonuclease P protein subunit RPR2